MTNSTIEVIKRFFCDKGEENIDVKNTEYAGRYSIKCKSKNTDRFHTFMKKELPSLAEKQKNNTYILEFCGRGKPYFSEK